MEDSQMRSLAEEFQRRMDLSDKSFTSSLELSKEGTVGRPKTGILVEEVNDPYQFLEDSSADGEDAYGNDFGQSGRQLSTSDLMQTDADAMPDPVTLADRNKELLEQQNFAAGASYLQTSDGGSDRIIATERVLNVQQEFRQKDFGAPQHSSSIKDEMREKAFPLSDRNAVAVDPKASASDIDFKLDSLESANDRIAALRQQFMSFRKQSEVMSAKPLELHHDRSAANLTAQSTLDNHAERGTHAANASEIRGTLQENLRDAINLNTQGYARSRGAFDSN